MDLDTAKALEAAVRMIDNVNDRSMLNSVSLDLSVILAAALRRQNLLSPDEVSSIDQALTNAEETWPEGRAEKAHKVLKTTQALWAAAEPR